MTAAAVRGSRSLANPRRVRYTGAKMNAGRVSLLLLALVSAHAPACRSKSTSEEPSKAPSALPPAGSAPAPVAFQFAKLPDDYARVELYGAASESILAPKGARVSKVGAAVLVEAGEYRVVITQGGPSQEDFKRALSPYAVQDAAPDVLIYRDGDRFNFRALQSRTPEWDDTDVRRYACSAGPVGDPPPPSLNKKQVELLVSACRSIELPALE